MSSVIFKGIRDRRGVLYKLSQPQLSVSLNISIFKPNNEWKFRNCPSGSALGKKKKKQNRNVE